MNASPALLTRRGTGTRRPEDLRAAFLDAMAELASGVSIVTSIGLDGALAGATVTSVVSACADPPMLGISLGRSSRSLAAIQASNAFAINVLRPAGRGAAQVFASRADDKFGGVAWELTPQGLPWFPAACTHAAVCRLVAQVPAGDHTLVLGTVEEVYPGRPGSAKTGCGGALVYWRRGFHELG